MPHRATLNTARPKRQVPGDLQQQVRIVADADYPIAILDAVSVPVFVLNQDRQIVFANSAFRELMPDGDPAGFIGRRTGDAVQCIHVNDSTPGGCGSATACRNCEAIMSVLHAQARGRDERTFQLALHGGRAINAIVRATRTEIAGESFIIVALLDIKDTLWHRDAERAFLHDVINVAGSIRGAADAMAGFDAETQRIYAAQIVTACDTLITEINSHRLMIEAEDGDLEPVFEPIESLPFLERMAAIVSQHEVARDRMVRIAPTAETHGFESDQGLVSRVVVNLLKNALEASAPGQTVTANTGAGEATVWFTIHNESHIPPRVSSRIFQRFFSTRGPSRGLGTYSARLLTERYLGGAIGFTTAPGAGTTFTVRYPLTRPPAPPRPNISG